MDPRAHPHSYPTRIHAISRNWYTILAPALSKTPDTSSNQDYHPVWANPVRDAGLDSDNRDDASPHTNNKNPVENHACDMRQQVQQ